DVGGIPEVVQDGVTGTLVHYDEADEATFEADIATAVNALALNPEKSKSYGLAGRARAVESFSWASIAAQTVDIYRSLISGFHEVAGFCVQMGVMTVHRPELHFAPESGIVEAPAGALLDGNTWHLFFQHRADPGSPSRWGHTFSEESPFDWLECD